MGLGTAVSGPASTWAAKLPDGIPRLVERVRFLEGPLGTLQDFWHQIESFAGWQEGASSTAGTTLLGHLFTGTRNFASQFFTTLLFLFFLLVAGEVFLQRLVEIMPRFSSKRQVVNISQQIETDISAYLVTITCMNAAVGVGTAAVMWFTGVGDPVLWGTIAFLLNFVPIIGPLIGVLIFLLAGALAAENIWSAFIPAGLYLVIHLIEGELVTPMLLAKRFTLNPVGHCISRLLVLDVGSSWSDPVRANACGDQNCLRPGSASRRHWTFSGRLREVILYWKAPICLKWRRSRGQTGHCQARTAFQELGPYCNPH